MNNEQVNVSNKVYVIFENSVWDDEDTCKVIGVFLNKKAATQIFNKYVENIKKTIDFDELDAISENENIDNNDGWIYDKTEDQFSIYLNGEYNSYHINVVMDEFDLINEHDNEELREISI